MPDTALRCRGWRQEAILRLLENRARFYALAYVGASLLGGFGAVGLGWTLGTVLT